MAETQAVEILGLTKRIGRKLIVDDLTFTVPHGEVFGFLGPNGAGKTTTIRMIVRLMSATRGRVLINGLDVSTHFIKAMRHVGAIVENPEMYKFLSGYQNLRLYARMVPDVNEERIQTVVKLVGLQHRINDKVKRYSLGMRQRLGLAQALLHRPSVLILDEPTNGLDPAGIRELRDHLRNLARTEGMAVIVSSHLLAEMELMCDRVAIIQNGKLVRVDRLRELMEDPAGTLVAFTVDEPSRALDALAGVFPNAATKENNGRVEATLGREQIPVAINALVGCGVQIFAVERTAKTLEDTFLEMTGGGEIV